MTTGGRRAVWALLILVVLGFVLMVPVCRSGRQPPPPAIAGTELKLGGMSAVEGSEVFRAELYDGSGGYSSGYGRTRNIAFIQRSGEAHWLLPDDDHIVGEHQIPAEPTYGGRDPKPPVAYAALVKPAGAGSMGEGQMLLYDPSGRNIRSVAEGVLEIHGVALSVEQGITVLYERPGQYIMATFDATTLAKRSEVPVTLPRLR